MSLDVHTSTQKPTHSLVYFFNWNTSLSRKYIRAEKKCSANKVKDVDWIVTRNERHCVTINVGALCSIKLKTSFRSYTCTYIYVHICVCIYLLYIYIIYGIHMIHTKCSLREPCRRVCVRENLLKEKHSSRYNKLDKFDKFVSFSVSQFWEYLCVRGAWVSKLAVSRTVFFVCEFFSPLFSVYSLPQLLYIYREKYITVIRVEYFLKLNKLFQNLPKPALLRLRPQPLPARTLATYRLHAIS